MYVSKRTRLRKGLQRWSHPSSHDKGTWTIASCSRLVHGFNRGCSLLLPMLQIQLQLNIMKWQNYRTGTCTVTLSHMHIPILYTESALIFIPGEFILISARKNNLPQSDNTAHTHSNTAQTIRKIFVSTGYCHRCILKSSRGFIHAVNTDWQQVKMNSYHVTIEIDYNR